MLPKLMATEVMSIPAKYEPELIDAQTKQGWLNWSLDFFTDPNILQVPYLDITIQLDVTEAYAAYKANPVPGATFFAFLLWHLAQTLVAHPSFNMRFIENQWYILKNPPILIPVAIGGKERFWEVILENISTISYEEFVTQYRLKVDQARNGQGSRSDLQSFCLSHFLGNLPNLQFTGLTLQWRRDGMVGQPMFYFGKRYEKGSSLLIPFAAKLHHACADPFVLDLLLRDFKKRFTNFG